MYKNGAGTKAHRFSEFLTSSASRCLFYRLKLLLKDLPATNIILNIVIYRCFTYTDKRVVEIT